LIAIIIKKGTLKLISIVNVLIISSATCLSALRHSG